MGKTTSWPVPADYPPVASASPFDPTALPPAEDYESRRAAELVAVLERGATAANAMWGTKGKRYFSPASAPRESPWRFPDERSIEGVIARVWEPAAAEFPLTVLALQRICVQVLVRHDAEPGEGEPQWELVYFLACHNPLTMERDMRYSKWCGAPSSREPFAVRQEIAPWVASLPDELKRLYSVHYGFGQGFTRGVEVFHRADELCRVGLDCDKLLVECYCDSGGGRLVFAKDKTADLWEGHADWDHETGVVTPFPEPFDRVVARTVLSVDAWEHPDWAEVLRGRSNRR